MLPSSGLVFRLRLLGLSFSSGAVFAKIDGRDRTGQLIAYERHDRDVRRHAPAAQMRIRALWLLEAW